MTDSLVLGVDGGGTKTDAAVATLDGRVIGRGRAGASNWEGVGIDGARDALRAAVDDALDSAAVEEASIAAAGFALAGCDWRSDHDRLAPALDATGIDATRRTLVNDCFGALLAGAAQSHGVASVAGTGGSTCGRNARGEMFRTFAGSIGEGSGASGIVRAAIEALARDHHGSAAPTALTPALLGALGFDSTPALFEALMRERATRVFDPSLARVVSEVADAGDACAREIMASAGEQHGRDVVGVARRLDMLFDEVEVVCAGGVHGGDATFRAAFRAEVRLRIPAARFLSLAAPPVVGAVVLALEHAGIDPPARTAARAALQRELA